MILKSILHQNDISCKRISPFKTLDIVCRELLMDSVYVYIAMCLKSALYKRAQLTKGPYCQTIYEANSAHLFTIWLILNLKPTFSLTAQWRDGALWGLDSLWLCLPTAKRTSYLSQFSPLPSGVLNKT